MKSRFYIPFVLIIFIFGCKELEPRRPKQHSTKNFYEEVVAQNKKLNALETQKIQSFIKNDTLANYISSANGFWYTYVKKDTLTNQKPVKGDEVTINYNITTIKDDVIYDYQTRKYKIDEEDFVPGLREGIKLMKKGETITFVVPSYRAYGVTGDGNRIGMNQSLKSIVTLIEIKKPNNEIK